MRIIAGSARGRRLSAPQGRVTRPTSDRVKEAIFDLLIPFDMPDGAAVVDLFAGSGALGLEAASRGARAVTLVDSDRAALKSIRDNLEVLEDLAGEVRVVPTEAITFLRNLEPTEMFDLALADPPYSFGEWEELLAALEPHAKICVVESAVPVGEVPGWHAVRQRRYGSTLVTVLRSQNAQGTGEEHPGS